MKIITVCGSLKFEEEMKYYAEKLELEGNCVLSIIYPTKEKEKYTQEEINILGICHYKKIEVADVIFVVNKNGYIGNSVKKEIEYAKNLNKEIMYLEETSEENNTIYFNKLVRNKIVKIIEEKGKEADYEVLSNENFLKELNKKLIEEVNEFTEENNVEELADIFEVIFTIIENKNFDINEIEKIRLKKKEEKGGFEDRIFLKNVKKR